MTLPAEPWRLVDGLRSPFPAVRDPGAYSSPARLAGEGRPDTRGHDVELGRLQAEDDPVAYAVTAMPQRDLVDRAEVRRQVDRLAGAWLDAPAPLAPPTDNDAGRLLRPAAGHAVEAALSAALAARHPFLVGTT
jgi:hypothetical protein